MNDVLQVDGQSNLTIQSIFLDKYPVYCAHFSHDGKEVILGSRHSSFFYYDMIAGKVINVPRIKGKTLTTFLMCFQALFTFLYSVLE